MTCAPTNGGFDCAFSSGHISADIIEEPDHVEPTALVDQMMVISLELHSALSRIQDGRPAQTKIAERKIREAINGLDRAVRSIRSTAPAP